MFNSIKKIRKFLPVLFNNKNRKSLSKIVWEMLVWSTKHRSFAVEYFSRYLYLNNSGNIYNYVPNKTLYTLAGQLNNQHAIHVLLNKHFFYLFFSQFNISLAKLLLYNHKQVFFFGNNTTNIKTPAEFQELLKNTMLDQSIDNTLFIKKTFDSYGGRNIYKLKLSDLPLPEEKLNILYKEITESNYLFQETIEQHPALNKLNDSCVNSIRCDSFTDKNGKTEIMSAYLRLSIRGLPVDNTTSGGCFVGINTHTGRLMPYAYTSITRAGGAIYEYHPVSKVRFKDYKIPFFKEAVELVKKAASLVPNIKLIGWDIAIQPSGPLLIEGNHAYDITAHDLIYGGYRRNEVFRKLLKEIK